MWPMSRSLSATNNELNIHVDVEVFMLHCSEVFPSVDSALRSPDFHNSSESEFAEWPHLTLPLSCAATQIHNQTEAPTQTIVEMRNSLKSPT